MNVPWPANPAASVLHAQLVLAWVIVSYGQPDRGDASDGPPVWRAALARALAAGGIAALIPGPGHGASARLVSGAVVALVAGALPLARQGVSSTDPRRAAVEPIVVAVTVVAVGICTGLFGMGGRPWLVLPTSDRRLTAAAWVVAGAVFLGQGGTLVVRALLDAVGTVPRKPERDVSIGEDDPTVPRVVDVKEYNRGRVIGHLERLVLYVLALVGAYAAIGFVVTAKGLVRMKDLEERDFAEYFLVGSLASALTALVVAEAVRLTLP